MSSGIAKSTSSWTPKNSRAIAFCAFSHFPRQLRSTYRNQSGTGHVDFMLVALKLTRLRLASALERVGWWPAQARFWLEWGSSRAGQSFPAARSRFLAVHSHSISTRPSQPVAYCMKLRHSQSSRRSHNLHLTGLRWI